MKKVSIAVIGCGRIGQMHAKNIQLHEQTNLVCIYDPNEEFAKNLHLLKKLGEPEDIANAVYYMCSDDAGWVTGEVLTIDGGFLLSGNSMI